MYETPNQGKETPGLEDYLTAIRQRKFIIIVCGLLGLVAVFLLTASRTETFTAESRVLVNPTAVGSTDGRLVNPSLEREREVIDSNAIAERAADSLGIGQSGRALLQDLEVVFVDGSDSLELSYESEDPETATSVVNAFASAYVTLRVEQAEMLDNITISELQQEVDAIDAQLEEVDEQIAAVTAERSRIIAANAVSLEPVDVRALDDQLLAFRNTIGNLRVDRRGPASDLAAAQLEVSTRIAPAEVLQFATVPSSPNGLSDLTLQLAGLIFGLGAGVALAFVLHRLDRTARESSDVELALGSNVLASIPQFGLNHRSGKAAVVMIAGGRSAKIQQARESFRRLRSSVQFLGASRDASTYVITSARPAEGKSTVAVNLAVALAQSGTRVCLVNCDLRRPTVEPMLGVSNSRGLSTWLEDNSATDIMVRVEAVPNLVVVPSGPIPQSPGELIATGGFSNLLESLSSQFEVTIVDAPPVLSAADASIIAPAADGTLIVVDGRRTDTDALLRVRDELARTGGHVLGAVLNRDNTSQGPRLGRDRYAYERVSAARSAS